MTTTTATTTMFRLKRINSSSVSHFGVQSLIVLLLRLCIVTSAKFHNSQERQHQRFAMEPQDQIVIVGSRVTLPCRVVDKTGQIQWTKDDFGLGVHRNLSGYDRYSMVGSDEEGDFSLDIYPVMLEDNARYQCQVSAGVNGAVPIRSRSAQLTVLIPPQNPQIIRGNSSIDEIVTTEDREIELECVSSGGKPAAEITWIDGSGNVITSGIEYMKKLMSDNKRYEARSILKLIPKRSHHNTTITCQALNSADRQEKTAKLKLTVKYAPKVNVKVISGALANEKIPEGAEVRLACHAEANPSELTYRWYINGEPAIGDYTTEMIIHNISRKYHDAIIKCEVQNAVGKSESSETLEIRYGPAFKSPLKSVEADEGDTVTLVCDVDGNPSPDIEWIFNPSGKTVGTSANLTLTITNDHVGSYTCRASVMGIFIEAEASIHLKGPPSITSAKKQFGIPGETAQIECVAFSIPKVKHILWSYNGRDINSSQDDEYTIVEDVTSYGMKSTLVIHKSDTKHFGRYNCSVANDYGHDNMEIILSGLHDSQVTYVFIVLAIILFIVMVAMISVICIKSGKRKLPPADMISEHHITEKSFKDSDRFSNTSELKDPDRDYSEYSGTESTATRTAINILGSNGHTGNGNIPPLAGPVKLPNNNNNNNNNHRFSGDFTDGGMHIATKVGLTNNGYIPYSDYTRDYSPPNSMRTNITTSLKNHLISSSGHSPLINSTPVTMNGGIDSYTLGRNRELRQDNGLPIIPLNTMPNGIINQSLLNNVDIRYSATYGNPYLKNSSISPLPPPITHKPYTANPSITPAPPPYNRSNNSNSSFSSSTTISNSGSLLGGANTNTNNINNSNNINNNLGLSYPNSSSSISTGAIISSTNVAPQSNTQITSPSRQFILPANGDLKKGSLATHV